MAPKTTEKEVDDLKRVIATLIVYICESEKNPITIAQAAKLLGMLHGGIEEERKTG